MIVLNFDNADIETVIHAASEIVGFNYVLAPDVRGKVTVQTSGRIATEDVFGVLLAILEVQGFTAVKSGSLYKIIRIEGARERAVPTIVGPNADPARNTDEVITQIVPIRFSNVNDLSTLMRPLVSTRGNLIAHRETNILVITDAASNVRRLLDIVRLVDVEVAIEELQIIPIRYADAGDLATILNQLTAAQLQLLTASLRDLANGALNELNDAIVQQVRTQNACTVLDLSIGPLTLNLLGLEVQLDNCAEGPLTVTVTAVPGSGNLLGNLLCGVLGGVGVGTTLSQILQTVLGGILGALG